MSKENILKKRWEKSLSECKNVGVLETLISGYVGGIYKNFIAYLLLLLFLFVKPTGIFNERAIKDV